MKIIEYIRKLLGLDRQDALNTQISGLQKLIKEQTDCIDRLVRIQKTMHREISTMRLEIVFGKPIFSTSTAAVPTGYPDFYNTEERFEGFSEVAHQ
jgi:hypothetical protein